MKLVDYCTTNNISISSIYKDISSGMSLNRKQFNVLIDEVLKCNIDTVFITNKDRICRTSFKTIEELFSKYGTKICTINDNFNKSQ